MGSIYRLCRSGLLGVLHFEQSGVGPALHPEEDPEQRHVPHGQPRGGHQRHQLQGTHSHPPASTLVEIA